MYSKINDVLPRKRIVSTGDVIVMKLYPWYEGRGRREGGEREERGRREGGEREEGGREEGGREEGGRREGGGREEGGRREGGEKTKLITSNAD